MANLAKVEEIYHAAVDLPEEQRLEFLTLECNGDDELFREVKSLIEFDQEAHSFIESPPDDVAADVIEALDSSHQIIRKTLTKYRVLSQIGAGGMGDVFLAEDTKLDRKVALKILPSRFSTNRERELRFEQEAKALSALNKRNIITIFEIAKVESLSFMAMEFVDGVTLREKMVAGPLRWREAVDIGIQIASALAAAHSVGIIHRDIKPANVMVRHDGEVKVLDFGLAKLTQGSPASGSFETRDHTAHNRVMGTINYMSPEQALGETLDARTDIFSLGVVLYEMIAGEPLFGGTSDAAVYNATLNKQVPPLAGPNTDVPHELDAILSRALAKAANDRYQSVEELRDDLKQLCDGSREFTFGHSPTLVLRQDRFSSTKFAAVAAFMLLSAAATGLYFWFGRSAPPPESAKAFKFTQLTSDEEASMPSLSPDGKTVIFSSRRTGNWDVYAKRLDESNPLNLTQNSRSNDRDAVFSPNGEQIAFSSDRDVAAGIFLMERTGENIRKVADIGHNPSWSPDGTEIVYSTGPVNDPNTREAYPASLWIANLVSGEKRELTREDAVQPQWSPGGHSIAFWATDLGGIRDIKTISSKGGDAVAITNDPHVDWNPVWSRDGKYLYFSSNRGGSMNFWRVPIDEQSGEALGSPEPFTTPSTFSQDLTFSGDGRTFAFAQQIKTSNILRAEFQPGPATLSPKTTVIGKSARHDRNPSVSPDGQWIAFDAIKDGQEDLFLMRLDGTDLRQLTDDVNKDRAPRWSPDGRQLVFYTDRSGANESWTINVNGTGLKQITYDTHTYGMIAMWSPDGSKMVQSVMQNYPKIFATKYDFREQTTFQIPSENEPTIWEMAYSWSPDGTKIAQLRQASDSPLSGIVVYDVLTKSHDVVSELGDVPVWLNDNRRLIFADGNRLVMVDTLTKRSKELLILAPTDRIKSLTITPDNSSVYFAVVKNESDLWIGTIQ